jgi:uncharacterized protein (TIGR02453 family)
VTPSFAGIPVEALDFHEGLEDDNTRSYWTAHRQVYEDAVRAPVVALTEALAPEFGPAKVFRPYQDVRFAKGRAPYKTAQGAVVGNSETGSGALYVQVSAAGLLVAAGFHGMAPDQLARYRAAVDDPRRGEALREVLAAVTAAGHRVGGDLLKTRPRGVAADHPLLDLMRHRSLTASHDYGCPAWLHTPRAAEVVASTWRELAPLNAWLADNVGGSQLPPR